ncbi:tripartite tricarboxylate transporter permease [Lachnospiraceae bacterium 62-35]
MILESLSMCLTVHNLFMMCAGVIIGLVFGAIPGLTYMTGILLVLPMTYGMDTVSALSILLGIYCAGMTGGSVSAILLGIPGTPSAAATVLDGYPMSQKGHGEKALGTALTASVLGGLISLLILTLVAPQISDITRKFSAAERFALIVLGLSCICRVSSKNMLKGLISAIIGIMITMVGMDPIMGVPRYSFGSIHLLSGIDLLPVLIGMFAIPEIISSILNKKHEQHMETKHAGVSLPRLSEMRQCLPSILRGSVIGTVIGAIPGTGGPTACFLAYDDAKRNSKNSAQFGTGVMEGIAAPEAANNAVSGGAMIPMLTMGIPGDGTTAVLMGALMIHGLQPGPLLFQEDGKTVYAIFISMFLINLIILLVQSFGIRIFSRVLDVPLSYLNGIIVALCVVGSYAQNGAYYDVIVMLAAGGLCYLMKWAGFPSTPLLLGVALGGGLEENFRLAMTMAKGNVLKLITRPICAGILLITILLLVQPVLKESFKKRKENKASHV